MLDVLHQNAALSHDVLLLEETLQVQYPRIPPGAEAAREAHGSPLRLTSFFFMMIFFCSTLTA